MKSNRTEKRQMMALLDQTHRATKQALANLDPQHLVHHGSAPWSIRDVLGHVGVWNGEAAKSLHAHARGGEYRCIPSEAKYDEYNGIAVDERRTWTVEQVWAEYEASHEGLKLGVETMSDEDWEREMLYPWNEVGATWRLIKIMMKHEEEHRTAILAG